MGWRGAIEPVIVTYVRSAAEVQVRGRARRGGALNSGVESIITFAELALALCI